VDKWIGSVGIAEVQARSGAKDFVAADRPVPRGYFRGNSVVLLAGMKAKKNIVLNQNVVYMVFEAARRVDSKAAVSSSTAVDPQLFDCQIARVVNSDDVASTFAGDTSLPTNDRGSRSIGGIGPSDGDPRILLSI
jgi:hypothetical protein